MKDLLNSQLDKAETELNTLHTTLKDLRSYIAGEPTDFDFKSCCESINLMLKNAGRPEKTLDELRGIITGGESFLELKEKFKLL